MLTKSQFDNAISKLFTPDFVEEAVYEIFGEDTTVTDIVQRITTDEVYQTVCHYMKRVPVVDNMLTNIASNVWEQAGDGLHICRDKGHLIPMLAKRHMFHIGTTWDRISGNVQNLNYARGHALYLDEYGHLILVNLVHQEFSGHQQTIRQVESWNAEIGTFPICIDGLAGLVEEDILNIFEI